MSLASSAPTPTTYPGVYLAQVYANNDPQGLFRLWLYIPQIYGLQPVKIWAPPVFQPPSVPTIGTAVWCIFHGGDPSHPTYIPPVGSITRQTVTGSRGGNAALASLLTALARLGLILDSTTP